VVPEPVAVMLLVAEALEKLGVPYLVGGSLASAVHMEIATKLASRWDRSSVGVVESLQ